MTIDDYDGHTLSIGRWKYGKSVDEIIEIVAFDCDYFFDRLPAQDSRDVWEPYPLNSEGRLIYLKAGGDVMVMKPFQSVDEAKAWANNQPWAPIDWQDA